MVRLFGEFQNCVILDSNKTLYETGVTAEQFQNRAILDSNKTNKYNGG